MAEPKPITPTPNVPIFIWPTPNHEDRLFWVWRDGTLPKYREWKYGDAFDEDEKYKNYKLIHVSPQSDTSWSKWFYMAPREDEDEYNWEFAAADIGGTKFDAVLRKYVIPRADYDPVDPVMGDAMPDVPSGKFTGAYVLAERKQKHPSPELDSLFVTEDRLYVRKVSITNYKQDPDNGIANYVVTTLYYRGEEIDGTPVETYFATSASPFWVSNATGYGNDGKQLSENWFAVTYHQVVNTDTEYGIEVNRLRKSHFFCPQDVTATTLITTDNSPGLPATPGVSIGQSVAIKQKGRIRHKKTIVQNGSPKPIKGTTVYAKTGETFIQTQETVPASEVAAGSVDASGTLVTYEPDDACNSVKSTRKVVSTKKISWTHALRYDWPPVLVGISWKSWALRKGGARTYPRAVMKTASLQPQIATVEQWWQLTPETIVLPTAMIKSSIEYWCPFFQLQIPACLHGLVEFTVTSGTEDPVWVYTGDIASFAATPLTDWPSELVWTEVEPHLGGYYITKTTLKSPEFTITI